MRNVILCVVVDGGGGECMELDGDDGVGGDGGVSAGTDGGVDGDDGDGGIVGMVPQCVLVATTAH